MTTGRLINSCLWPLASGLLLLASCLLTTAHAASPNVPLGSWVYPYIEKLASLGYMDSYIAGQLPLNRVEVAQLVDQAEEKYNQEGKASDLIPGILNRLKREFTEEIAIMYDETDHISYLKPLQSFYFEYPYLGNPMDMENEAGRIYGEQNNFQGGFVSQGEMGDHFAFLIHPEFRERKGLGYETKIIEGYGKLSFKSLEIEGGLDTMWWGQGRHGNLLLSNNAQSFKILKMGHSSPTILPWILKYLGAAKFSFFVAKLDDNRPHLDPSDENPKFCGMKLSIKPFPFFEWASSRTFITSDFWNGLIGKGTGGKGSTSPLGPKVNHLGGHEWRLRIPLKLQPVTFYGEHIGGEEGWIHLWGFYLPRILNLEKLDIRIEYANTWWNQDPSDVYRHARFDYTYKGRIMGHHMDRDADDLFVGFSYYVNPDLKIGFSFDGERHGKARRPIRETKKEYTFSIEYWPKSFINWHGTFQWEDIDNKDFCSGVNEGRGYFRLGTAFYF